MNRMLAIVEREMRKFFRSPALMMVSMIFPLVQLIVLGNAFGGKIRDARLGLVDQDGGTQALKNSRGLRFGPRQHAHLPARSITPTRRRRWRMCATERSRALSLFLRSIPAGFTNRTSRRSRWWWITATIS